MVSKQRVKYNLQSKKTSIRCKRDNNNCNNQYYFQKSQKSKSNPYFLFYVSYHTHCILYSLAIRSLLLTRQRRNWRQKEREIKKKLKKYPRCFRLFESSGCGYCPGNTNCGRTTAGEISFRVFPRFGHCHRKYPRGKPISCN